MKRCVCPPFSKEEEWGLSCLEKRAGNVSAMYIGISNMRQSVYIHYTHTHWEEEPICHTLKWPLVGKVNWDYCCCRWKEKEYSITKWHWSVHRVPYQSLYIGSFFACFSCLLDHRTTTYLTTQHFIETVSNEFPPVTSERSLHKQFPSTSKSIHVCVCGRLLHYIEASATSFFTLVHTQE